MSQDSPDGRRSALDELQAQGALGAVTAMLSADQAEDPATRAAEAERLHALAQEAELPQLYAELAELKSVMLAADSLSLDDKLSRLEPLSVPGAPYRQLAMEQMALAHLAEGDRDAALDTLLEIQAEGPQSQGLRRRVSQLIVALGGEVAAG